MPYLQRNEAGRVCGVFLDPPAGESEFVSASHPELRLFMDEVSCQPAESDPRRLLAELDGPMSRVLEDLLDVLIKKHIILLTDLPPEAQQKLLSRQEARRGLIADAAGLDVPARDIF